MPLSIWSGSPLEPFLASIWNHLPHRMVDEPADADFLLFPGILWAINEPATIRDALHGYREAAQGSKKTLLAFACLDTTESVEDLQNTLLFRTSLARSTKLDYEHPLPYPWECRNEAFPPLRHDTLSVSFCGFARSHPVRIAAIEALTGSPIKTDFILRDAFWGGRPHDPDMAREFWENLERRPFALCCRGAGNFSIRFYQALSAGRIPVVVDTDMVFPCADVIDWPNTIVLADSADGLEAAIRKFAETRNVVDAQLECRRIFDAHLSQTGFATWLASMLQDKSHLGGHKKPKKPR